VQAISFRAEYSITSVQGHLPLPELLNSFGSFTIQVIVRDYSHPGLSKGLVEENCIVYGRSGYNTAGLPNIPSGDERDKEDKCPKLRISPRMNTGVLDSVKDKLPDTPSPFLPSQMRDAARIVDARKCSRRVSG